MTSEHRKRGAKHSRYTIKAKSAVAEYSLLTDPDGQGPGNIIGAQEAARCYLISDEGPAQHESFHPECF